MIHFSQIIPLKDPKHDKILVSMISLMICSILVIGCSALFLTNLSTKWHKSVTHMATLEIPDGTQNKTTSRVEVLLKNNKLIKNYKVINKEEIKKIIAPWVDQGVLDSQHIPLPTIFTLTLRSGDNIERDKLKFALKAIDEDLKLETHRNWLDTAFQRAETLKILAWIIGFILTLTLVISLSILTRTRILLNADIISLLHTSGASDSYILQQFISYIFVIAFKGIIYGSILATILLFSLAKSTTSESNMNFTFNALTQNDVIMLCITPFVILAFMLITTSRTVMTALKKMI